ncbi:DUF1801 domain-containing protein [Agrococcus sp. SL85]|uniref:DUF1801 domain-containing protein n=1 Tax=Agrococcus sp. SL85 TaxID=2995141 RepID=UPI00226D1508|nr:DUF1801 domain-containing protein [Agrococcus sp. SL85]WAC65441.1 DUF1801 domain-containing protein [Agrococcus sp. SL85]
MAEPAMRPTGEPVEAALDRASGPRRAEADDLLELFAEVSGEEPIVWARRIIGFGEYEYRYETGHGGRSPLLAFATGPKQHTLYLEEEVLQPDALDRLGPHRLSKVCLHLTRLSGVDREVLRQLLQDSLAVTRAKAV